MLDQVVEALSNSAIARHLGAWGVIAILIYNASFFITRSLAPGFPADLMRFMKHGEALRPGDFYAFLVAQIDKLFAFRQTKLPLLKFAPSFLRSALASVLTLLTGTVFLMMHGHDVVTDAFAHISGEAFAANLSATANGSGIFGEVHEHLPQWGLLLLGTISAVCVFVTVLIADYISVAQTRRFMEFLAGGPAFIVPVLLVDLLVSILILIVSVTLAMILSSVIVYVGLWLYSQTSSAGGLELGSFFDFMSTYCVPRLFIAGSLLVDGASSFFGAPPITPHVLNYLERLYGFGMPYPVQRNIFSLVVLASLLTSIWVWLSCIAVLISRALRVAPIASKKAVEWTKAEEEPTRLFALLLIFAWTLLYIAQILLPSASA